jgi:hypothetical protein
MNPTNKGNHMRIRNALLTFVLANLLVTFSQAQTSVDMSLLNQSIQTCAQFSKDSRFAELKDAGAAMLVLVGAGSIASSLAAAGDGGLSLTLTTTGYIALEGAMQLSITLYGAFAVTDFARLAYELGTDQEGPVVDTFRSSCTSKSQGDAACQAALEIFKAQAKAGKMCSDMKIPEAKYTF